MRIRLLRKSASLPTADVQEHINGSLKHIKAFIYAGVMKTVTRVAGFAVQAKWLANAVRAALDARDADCRSCQFR